MNDDRLGKEIGDFYRETDVKPSDPRESARQVTARLGRTPQVGRRRWLPAWRSRTTRDPGSDRASSDPPRQTPATNGETTSVTGRTQTMLSPAKAVTVAALVFAIGGSVLVARPFDQRSDVPGAATVTFVDPVEVTGTMGGSDGSGCRATDKADPYEEAGPNAARYTCSTETGLSWSFSDPRLEGVVTRINEEVTFAVGDVSDVYVNSTAFSIENDGGAWRERPRTWLLPDGAWTFDWLPEEVLVLDGSGEYDGLVAVLRTTGGLSEFRGFIIDARWMPPPPENASTD